MEASINTIKYLKGPLGGFMGPQMSPCILCGKGGDSYTTLAKEGQVINLSYEHGVHKYPLGMVN